MPKLVTWMNNQRVGELTKLATGGYVSDIRFTFICEI